MKLLQTIRRWVREVVILIERTGSSGTPERKRNDHDSTRSRASARQFRRKR
jgi:hypothetical protein